MDILVRTTEELEELEIEYNLTFCGESGKDEFRNCLWFCDDEADVNVYLEK